MSVDDVAMVREQGREKESQTEPHTRADLDAAWRREWEERETEARQLPLALYGVKERR
jgi:hypothetical protein